MSSVVRTSLATLILRGASFGIRVACMLMLARKAGPHLFGTISILFTMAEITRVIADAGVDTLMLRNMATERGKQLGRSIGAALSAKALTGGLLGATLLVAMFRFSPATPLINFLIWMLALTPLGVNLGANFFIATQQTALVALRVIAITATAGALFITTSQLSPSVTASIAVVVAYEMILGSWLIVTAIRTAGIRPNVSLRHSLQLLRTSLPLGIAIAVGYTYSKLDIFVLKHFSGTGVVGQYSFWSRLLDPLLFLCGAVAVTAYGHLSAAVHEGDTHKTRAIARRYAILNLSISGSVAIALWILGGLLSRTLFPEYEATIWIGRLLAVLMWLRSANSILTAALQAAGRRKLIMMISLMNFFVALLACILLATIAGTFGVICGLLIMESVNFAVQLAFARAFLFSTQPAPTLA